MSKKAKTFTKERTVGGRHGILKAMLPTVKHTTVTVTAKPITKLKTK